MAGGPYRFRIFRTRSSPPQSQTRSARRTSATMEQALGRLVSGPRRSFKANLPCKSSILRPNRRGLRQLRRRARDRRAPRNPPAPVEEFQFMAQASLLRRKERRAVLGSDDVCGQDPHGEGALRWRSARCVPAHGFDGRKNLPRHVRPAVAGDRDRRRGLPHRRRTPGAFSPRGRDAGAARAARAVEDRSQERNRAPARGAAPPRQARLRRHSCLAAGRARWAIAVRRHDLSRGARRDQDLAAYAVRSIIDPNSSPLRAKPKDPHDVFVAATHSLVV